MNRRQRRAQARHPGSAAKIRELQRRVEATGKPGVIYGLTDACRDCRADSELILLPGHKVLGRVRHGAGCPVLAGAVDWELVAL